MVLTIDAEEKSWPHFFGYMGVASALIFANFGAAYGTAKCSIGISNLGTVQPDKIFRSLVPIIMAGILGIYGLIVSVLLVSRVNDLKTGVEHAEKCFKIMAAGLCCGLSAFASGIAIGVAGDAGVRAYAQTDGIFIGMILILIFGEAIGLYGLIVAIIISAD